MGYLLPPKPLKVHAKHHTHSTVRACEVVRNSPIDVAVDSACSVIALNFNRWVGDAMSMCAFLIII